MGLPLHLFSESVQLLEVEEMSEGKEGSGRGEEAGRDQSRLGEE